MDGQLPPGPASEPPLYGRTREQRLLQARLDAAFAGQGSLVLIGGEAGIGKTTLADWLVREARQQGALVLRGQCYDLTQAPAYGPWREALANGRPGDPEAAHPLRPETGTGEMGSQSGLFVRVHEHLARLAGARPVLLVLEDVHWSDPDSLELLRALARALHVQEHDLAVLLLVTYRVDAQTRRHPFFQLLPHLVREARAERLDLARLNGDDVYALVTDRYALAPADEARLAAFAIDRAEGNPFYLDELLRTLEADQLLRPAVAGWALSDLTQVTVPPFVRQIIEGRLQTLDPETLRLLEMAAVIGQEVPLDLWQMVSGTDDERLAQVIKQAIAAHLLLEATPTSVAFVHALVRETLDERQAPWPRRRTHQQVAELLAARPDPPLSVIASHFASADDPRAIDWLMRAGEQALALYAARDAVDALTRAHTLAARLGQPLPTAAYRTRAAASALLGEFASARHDHELVLARAQTAADGHAEFQALLDLGQLWAERDYERTGGYFRAALDLARRIGDEAIIARGLNRIANLHVNLDEPDRAKPLHLEALAIFERLGDRAGIAETLDLLAMANYLDCTNAASTAYYERAIPLFRELDDRPRLAFCLSMLALTGNVLDFGIAPTYREAPYWTRSLDESLAITRQIDWLAGEAFAHFSLSMITGMRGHFDRALHHAQAAERVARQIDHHQWTIAAQCALAAAWTALLEPERAVAELEQGLAAARISGSRYWTNMMAGRLASALLASGQRDHATALLGSTTQADRPGRSMGQRQCWMARIELFLAAQEPEEALAAIAALEEANPEAVLPPGPPMLLKLRGDALAQLQRHEDAAADYRAARDSAALYGYRSYLWLIDAARGSLLMAAGRQAEADVALRHARATIDDLAATLPDEAMREQFHARALARLPSSGPTPGAERAATATALSPRELDVLRLIVEGQSDREIAAALSISPRTVMRHVTGILTKLDVPSRTAAATVALRREIV